MAEKTFESALSRLEEIVKLIESGEVSLEETIKLYDEGLKLSMFCNEKLENAKQKIIDIEDYLKGTETNE